MIKLRKAKERGHADHGWLKTHHSFSFADYYDPEHMGFRSLRVINDDLVAPGQGFGTHPHRDMEIVSYVLQGGLSHKDSMGTGSTIYPGEVQYMSAGTGVLHSEFNHSENEWVHLIQIWIMPERRGLKPVYSQIKVPDEAKLGKLKLVASPDGADDSIQIRQDAKLYASILPQGAAVEHALADDRGAWLQVLKGEVSLNGQKLAEGDGAAIEHEATLSIRGVGEKSEFLLFDLK